MSLIIYQLCIFLTILQLSVSLPVKDVKPKEQENDNDNPLEYLEYHRYLKEIIETLETDSEFSKKLRNTTEEEIRSGKIADTLELVSHHVRTKLDEIKRIEVERLNKLIKKRKELQENFDTEDPTHKHLDHSNPHTFEIEDLKKLIKKSHEDLDEVDRMRRAEFKEYEMYKELKKQKKLNSTHGEERDKMEKEMQELEDKHRKHEKLHEPGHKAQLEEVWQEQDQMQQEFDPKTFFLLHDMDSNGYWDQSEVKALFLKELDKMYQAGAPEDDIRERIEEMERMRESVFKEVDTNRDGLIDFHEFLQQTKRQDFNEDHGWNGLDEQKPYTDEELQEYISRHQQMQQQHPPQYGHPGYQNVPPQAQFHPGQMPQQFPQQIPGHLPDINTNEINSQHQNNFNQHPNQVYQQHPNQGYQQHPNQGYQQPPQHLNQGYQQQQNQGYQQHPNQAYQQQHPNQAYQQQHPNQVYQQQIPNQAYQQQGNQAHQEQHNSNPPPPPPQQNQQAQQQLNQENRQPVQNNFQQQNQQPAQQGNNQNPNQGNAQNQVPQQQQQNNMPPQVQIPVAKQV